MSESEKPSANLPMVLVVILAMLGLATIPQGGGKPSEAPKAPAGAGQTGSPRAATDDDKHLGPLATVKADLWPEPTETAMPNPASGEAMGDAILQGGPELRFLIVLVPDPDDSSMSHDFDLTLSAVQRGTESAGFVAVRWSGMPGFTAATQEASGERPKPVSVRAKGAVGRRSVNLSVESSTPAQDETRWPAGILCRPTSSAKPGLENTRLLLLLVPESPTWGVDKARLTKAVKLAVGYISGHPGEKAPAAKSLPIRLIGPNFSGSYRSLLETLNPLAGEISAPVGSTKFTVYNGRSLSPDLKVLDEFPEPPLKFRSTVYNNKTLEGAILKYAEALAKPANPGRFAVLVESNTGFGQGSKGNRRGKIKIDYYAFPLNISQIREEYAARGFTRSNEPINLPSPDRLSPLEMVGRHGSRDLIPVVTPGPSAVEGELILSQILLELERRRYEWVGVVATNPYDRLFLAQKVRESCPDARLFSTLSSALYEHHTAVPYLRGMLVASTYPLALGSQDWVASPGKNPEEAFYSSGSDSKFTRVGFGNYFEEGVYNATVAHLAELGLDDTPDLLDYGFPGAEDSEWSHPPVWISVVGQRGLYPLTVDDSLRGFDLRLMSSVKDVGGIQKAGKGLIIVVAVEGGLHFRIFDHDGQKAVDMDQTKLTTQAGPIADLRKQLQNLWPPHELTKGEKALVIDAVTSIVDQTHSKIAAPTFRNKTTVPASPGRLSVRIDRGWVSVLLTLAFGTFAVAAWYLRTCPGSPVGERVWSRGVRERLDHPASRKLAALTASAGLGQLVVFSAPVWALTRVGDNCLLVVGIVLITLAASLATAGALLLALWRLRKPGRAGTESRAEPYYRGAVATASVLQVIFALAYLIDLMLSSSRADLCLYCSRATRMVDGVTPLVPLLLIGLAGWAVLLGDWRRVGLRVRLDAVLGNGGTRAGPLGRVRDAFQAAVKSLDGPQGAWPLAGPWAGFAVWVALALLAILCLGGLPGAVEPQWSFRPLFLLAYGITLGLLATRLVEMIGISRAAEQLLRRLAEVPLAGAFDRVPGGLARENFWRPASNRHRAEADSDPRIDRQFKAVIVGYVRLQGAIDAEECLRHVDRSKLEEFREGWQGPGLRRLPTKKWWEAVDALIPLLAPFWARRPMVTPSGAAEAGDRAGPGDVRAELQGWLNTCEDLVAMVMARQFAWLRATIDSVVGFLVAGLVVATLVLTCYPFEPQGPTYALIGALTAVTVGAIVVIAVQASRDEVLSRLNKTPVDRFTFERQFFATMVTSVVPLLGLLGALSYPLADLFRSLFEPFFRGG